MISNSAHNGGAMFVFFSNNADVSGNLMRGNSASNVGGAISLLSHSGQWVNNVIVDNRPACNGSAEGSGIYVQEGAPRLLHTTLARNSGGDGSSDLPFTLRGRGHCQRRQ